MTRHERAAAAIIEILRNAGDVGIAALCRDEIESALEKEFPEPEPGPEPEPPFLTAEHGRMLREMGGSLHYFPKYNQWVAVRPGPRHCDTTTRPTAAAAVVDAYIQIKDTNSR